MPAHVSERLYYYTSKFDFPIDQIDGVCSLDEIDDNEDIYDNRSGQFGIIMTVY